jgi:hypothetical protein
MQLKPVTNHDVTINNECIWFCYIMGFRLVTYQDCCEMNADKYNTAFHQQCISNKKECLITGSQIIRHLLHYAVIVPWRSTSTCSLSRHHTFTSHSLEEMVLTSRWASIMNSISNAAVLYLSLRTISTSGILHVYHIPISFTLQKKSDDSWHKD